MNSQNRELQRHRVVKFACMSVSIPGEENEGDDVCEADADGRSSEVTATP